MWGQNSYGQLGTGDTLPVYAPLEITLDELNPGETIASMDTQNKTTCALTSAKRLFCWGSNSDGFLGGGSQNSEEPNPTEVVLQGVAWKSVSIGYDHACALSTYGDAYCWGSNSYYGQAGIGSNTTPLTPTAVDTSGSLAGKTIKQISSSGYNSCALATDNSVHCWGQGLYGGVGNNNTTTQFSPVDITNSGFLNGNTVQKLIPGGYHTCALTTDGEIACWGGNDYNEVGINSAGNNALVPTQIDMSGPTAGKTFKQVIAGGYHTCAVSTDDKIFCWGYNDYNTTGVEDSSVSEIREIEDYGNLAGDAIVDMAAGYYFTCALTSAGEVGCWGYNSNSEPYLGIGEGQYVFTHIPTSPTLPSFGGKTIRSIEASGWSFQITALFSPESEPDLETKPGEPEEPEEPEANPNQPEIKKVINFKGNTAGIADPSKKVIRNVSQRINDFPVVNRVVLRFYVHPKKSTKAEIQLAKSRARAVKAALENRGVTEPIEILRVDRPVLNSPQLNQVLLTVQAGELDS
ncbi:MAG: hypothetical protein RL038_786 [Actinomycetota bacterium]|jgi:alpha-tubulin suppressor-like RCC1 family protein